jgi:hypothetical protein
MKNVTVPHLCAQRLKLAYYSLMLDDLPVDFDKVSELIQASGDVVSALERMPSIKGCTYVKAI